MGLQRRDGLFMSVIAVHQHQGHLDPVTLAQGHQLQHGDVEEALPRLYGQERFGTVHAHARAQPAVQLEHDGLVQCRNALGLMVRRQPAVIRQLRHRQRFTRRNFTGCARHKLAVIVLEYVNHQFRQPFPPHLLSKRRKAFFERFEGSVRCHMGNSLTYESMVDGDCEIR